MIILTKIVEYSIVDINNQLFALRDDIVLLYTQYSRSVIGGAIDDEYIFATKENA
jgi:5-keto 4-deoxyuronate isomerase